MIWPSVKLVSLTPCYGWTLMPNHLLLRLTSDERILGNSEFVEAILELTKKPLGVQASGEKFLEHGGCYVIWPSVD